MEESLAERLILVVEDNPDHVRLIEDTFHQRSERCHIVAIAQGTQALNFLHRRGDYTEAPRPDLILLNLNLSSQDGQGILAEIKAHPQFRRIPIVVLTFSAQAEDILKSYTLQGNCYVIKPSDVDQLAQIVKRIEEFWLGIVTLPIE